MERKDFLKTISLAGFSASALLTGCNTTSPGPAVGGGSLNGDAGLVQQAAEEEARVVLTYSAAIDSGLLNQAATGTAQLYRSHHQEHLLEFNDLLIGLGGEAVVMSNFSPDPRLSSATNQQETLELAMILEGEAAQAYFTQLVNELQAPRARQVFGDIFPIEVSHFVGLRAALGRQPAINSPFFSQLSAEQ